MSTARFASDSFARLWDRVMTAIETSLDALADTIAAVQAAQAAAALANTAASNAQAAATSAQAAADGVASVSAGLTLQNSSVTGLTVTASDAGSNATITVSAHTRIYADGASVAVAASSVTGLAYSTSYWIYYDQAGRAGGTVTYQATIDSSVAFWSAGTPDRHFVGAARTPGSGGVAVPGRPTLPPGYVEP
ncbi:MAG: hypothetical protein ACRC56_11885 [Bosea sp. (in: a-proteobacteria)]